MPETTIDPARDGHRFWALYGHGDTVHLLGRVEELPGLVTGISFWPGGVASYEVRWCDGTSTTHYGFELAATHTPFF